MVLGQIYYQGTNIGTSIVHRNMKKAFRYFNMVAKQYFLDDDTTDAPELAPYEAKLAGKAAAMLGKMYWRGDGVENDVAKANIWFTRGTQLDDPAATNGLGELFFQGVLGHQVNVCADHLSALFPS